jgi:hypothetical protein
MEDVMAVSMEKMLKLSLERKTENEEYLTLDQIYTKLLKAHGFSTANRLFGWYMGMASGLPEIENILSNTRGYKMLWADMKRLKDAGVIPEDLKPKQLPAWIKLFFASGFKASLLLHRLVLDAETREKVDLLLYKGQFSVEDARKIDKIFGNMSSEEITEKLLGGDK